jgi:quinoprotein glucose dehydrogenase
MKNPRRTVLSRFTGSEDDPQIDLDTEEVLLEIKQPWGNHNGGTVLFGPDGMLYLSVGDGGSAADPHGNGQNMST